MGQPERFRGGSRISGKGGHIYKGVGVCFADFILFFLNIPFGLTETKLFHFNRIFKNGDREVGSSEPTLDLPLRDFSRDADKCPYQILGLKPHYIAVNACLILFFMNIHARNHPL